MHKLLSSAVAVVLLVPTSPDANSAQDTLTQDTHVGTVFDRQGTALVRPVGRERWTPLAPRARLLPGDQVRTEPRGANALEVELAGGGTFIMGPGGLVELSDKSTLRLYRGEVAIKGGKQALQVRAPGFEQKVDKELLLRSDGTKTSTLTEPPSWLTGYRAATTDEWMGSLLAQVDGREVPLTVGYHKVTVEIRDQIARTTIEESFVNTTRGTLEGQFFFPLPADASISGFGMWIGDELVEADIVEKQRARAIYEDILRNRKDPGLLEWSGGNLFKARVFPIFPHSEKRIRIRYTQVLPMQGTTMRYRYALRSDLLQQHPLRELAIQTVVSSAVPIDKVTCTSHEARVRQTAHAGSVEFTAQEFAPDRDFEVRVDLRPASPLSVVPHRRGDDGYFMLMLGSPDTGGALQRALIPEGAPLDVLVLADTSGSMDGAARTAQADFTAALLACLGPKDRFRLAAADVDVRWWKNDAVTATEAQAQAALAFLQQRPSLGWTDLDRTFAAVLPRVRAGTTVIYVGDGIGTARDGDSAALGQRLAMLAKDHPSTFHAVSTASTYDQTVLEAIAAIGGGSVRATGEDPGQAAFDLLAEVAQPAIKDLKVSFEGLTTVRVYPERLPNLPAGTQQTVLGRFLPQGEGAQTGTVVVTGMLSGKPVRYRAPLHLAPGEEGNAFVPRLWARRHIDALLAQGRSPAIQAQIVAFSEEFGIMTPFTSFLVLESDADRERYGVTRRVAMRDGEQFFAQARDQASAELLRQQMQVARTWRLELRRRMQRELATLGRHLHAIGVGVGNDRATFAPLGGIGGQSGALPISRAAGDRWHLMSTDARDYDPEAEKKEGALEGNETIEEVDEPMGDPTPSEPALEREDAQHDSRVARRQAFTSAGDGFMLGAKNARANLVMADELSARSYFGRRGEARSRYVPQLAGYFFPHLPPPPPPLQDSATPTWPQKALDALAALDRRPWLAALDSGLRVELRGGMLHATRAYWTSRQSVDLVLGSDGWLLRTRARGSESVEEYVHGDRRGVVTAGKRLGRERKAEPTDKPTLPFFGFTGTDFVRAYALYSARIERADAATMVVILTAPAPQKYELRLTIDRARGVLLEQQNVWQGEATSTTRYADFAEVAGSWWPGTSTILDKKGRQIARHELRLRPITQADANDALRQARDARADVLLLAADDPSLDAAKQAVADRKAGFAEHFTIAIHYAASQQWDKVFEAWQAAEAMAPRKPGTTWLRAVLLGQGRHQQELKELLTALAPRIAANPGVDAFALAQAALALGGNALAADEVLVLLDRLRPAFGRLGDDADWQRQALLQTEANWLRAAGRTREGLDLLRRLAEAKPVQIDICVAYLDALWQHSERNAALAQLDAWLGADWLDDEANPLHERASNWLWETRDLPKLRAALERWFASAPANEAPYQRWLSILLFMDRQAEADAWVKATLAATLAVPVDPRKDTSLEATVRARLGAAVGYCLGQGWNYYVQRIDEQWLLPLTDLARRLMRVDDPISHTAQRILNDWRFRQTDAAATLRAQLVEDLVAGDALATMPIERLGRYVGVIGWDPAQVDATLWRNVVDRLRARFDASDDAARPTIAGYVLQVLDGHGESDEAVTFTRAWLAVANPDTRPDVAAQLMRRLVQQAWSQSHEDELIALLPSLHPKDSEPAARKALAAGAAHWLAEQLYAMRYAALMGPTKVYEALPRTELRARQLESRTSARQALAARLATASTADALHQRALELERLCLLAQLGTGLPQVDGEARELFSALDTADASDQLLRERCAYVIAYCAMRRPALGAAATQLLRTLIDPEPAPGGANPSYRPNWQQHLFRLLVVLDRVEDLTATLHAWIQPTKVESQWRIAYGYLLAETGKLAEAAAIFEGVAASDELRAPELAALADWYLALHRDADRERVLDARYGVMPEHELAGHIDREIRKLQPAGDQVPESLDPDVVRALRVLLGKASAPANHIWRVQQLYGSVKDFRVLECLAHGVLGHTEQAIYPFLAQISSVTDNIHEEATCDVIAARIESLQASAGRAIDRRALLLLTMLVERRAAEVLNAPGPHAALGLAAMRAAFAPAWLPGERRSMATFLAALGKLPQAEFAAEQVRQLGELHRLEATGSVARLDIALALAQTRWAYERHDAAIDQLCAALDELRSAQRGVLPQEADSALETLAGYHEHRGRFVAGESLLRGELAQQPSSHAQAWLHQRLFTLYVRCLENSGSTALGQGPALYAQTRAQLVTFLFATGPDQIEQALATYCNLHRAGKRSAGVAAAGDDLQEFARTRLPELLTLVPGNQQSMVTTVAQTIEELSGARAGLAFLIERIEAEPAVLMRMGQGGFSAYGWTMGDWRAKAEPLGAFERRLLRIVLAELERDLLSLQERNRAMYAVHNSYFWRAKASDFLAVALRVIEENIDSPARQLHAAQYLWHGLEQRERAVQVLTSAEARDRLRDDGRHRLVTWLHELGRFGESLPVVTKLVAAHPENLDYRVLQVTALHGVGRKAEAEAFLVATDKLFRDTDRCTEQVLNVLANLALQCEFHARAIALFDELIPLHQRTQPDRGVGHGTLSYYYQALARACVALGQTDRAVDAASAAIVAWGRDQRNRQSALEALLSVLRQLPDLDAYAKAHADKTARAGVDAPLLRKSFGRVYLERHEPAKAVPHLLAARDLQANDPETHQALLGAFDALKQPQQACAALLVAIATTPHDLDLSQDLARRLALLGDADAAERARTNLVEIEPEEAEGHRRLAREREVQNRFADAVTQWQQVVRVRTDEPEGWLALAQAQAHAGDRAAARQTLQKVVTTKWHARFGDVQQQAVQLLAPLSQPPR